MDFQVKWLFRHFNKRSMEKRLREKRHDRFKWLSACADSLSCSSVTTTADDAIKLKLNHNKSNRKDEVDSSKAALAVFGIVLGQCFQNVSE